MRKRKIAALLTAAEMTEESASSAMEGDELFEEISVPEEFDEDEWDNAWIEEEEEDGTLTEVLQEEIAVEEDDPAVFYTEDMPLAAAGDLFEADGITYSVPLENTVQVGDGSKALSGISGEINIPETVTSDGKEYTVVKVGNKAFFMSVR